MRKTIFLLVIAFTLICCTGNTVESSSNPVESSFKDAVVSYGNAWINGQWKTCLSYYFNARIAALGGTDEAIAGLEKISKFMKMTSWVVTKVQIKHRHDGIYTGVAHVTFLCDRLNRLNGKTYKMKVETGMIGHTSDQGTTWKFIGVTKQERALMQTLMPSIFVDFDVPKETFYVQDNGKWDLLKLP